MIDVETQQQMMYFQSKGNIASHMIQYVVKKAAKADLDKLGFKADVTNTFEEVQFRDNKHGLHGACCICLLHTFKQRYPDDCLASDVVHESIRGLLCFCLQ